jgi:signal transduction histidine kinase
VSAPARNVQRVTSLSPTADCPADWSIQVPGRAVTTAATVAVSALVLLSLWGELTRAGGVSPALVILDVAVVVLSCAAVPLVLRHPVATAGVLAVASLLSPVATPASTVATVHTARVRPLRTALLVAGAGVVGHLLRGLWRPVPGLGFGWWVLLVVAVHAALLAWGARARSQQSLVMALRERAARLERDQQRRVQDARLSERRRIAVEMHDTLAHRLSLLAAYAGAMEFRPDAAPEKVTAAAGVVRAEAARALVELREVIGVLRDDEDDLDRGAPQPTWSDVELLVAEARDAGASVEVQCRVDVTDLPPTLGRTSYRLVQEALTNARRHAPGQPVELVLGGSPGERLDIEVSNPVQWDHPGPRAGGTGLVGMRERVQLLGGELSSEVTAGRFRLHARLPWPER